MDKKCVNKNGKESKKNINNRTNLLIGILCILIVIFIIVLLVVNSNKEDTTTDNNDNTNENINYNESKDVASDKVVNGVKITNIKCSYDGFRTLLEYTISNNGSSDINLNDYELVIKDSDDNIIMLIPIGDTIELKSGSSLDTSSVIDVDFNKIKVVELNSVK